MQNTPFDQFLKGQDQALSWEAKKGAILFLSKARCVNCHSGNHFTDNKFHNVGFPQVGPGKEDDGNDRGLFLQTGQQEHLYQFKTPGLRNISQSAPYGHSGSLKTLRRVVEHYSHPMRSNHHYNGGFRNLPYELDVDWTFMNDRLRKIDPILGRMGVFLNAEEIDQITKFLSEGLTQKNF